MSLRVSVIRLGVAAFALLCIAGCGTKPSPQKFEQILAGIPAKRLESYSFDLSTRLIDRMKIAPEFLLSYLRDMDKMPSYSAYNPSDSEVADLQKNLDLLPPSYQQTLQQKLVGIYFISNWVGSGMADYVLSSKRELFTFLIINPETMKHDISDWITYRERTCFLANGRDDSHVQITVDCGKKYSGLTYLLLHETSHIMDYVHHYTPYVEEGMQELGQSVPETSFVKGIWAGYDTPTHDVGDRLLKSVSFYGIGNGAQLHASQASQLYEELKMTPFVSLYGSRNWAEDFAEYCTWYYFTTKLHQPYRIILAESGTAERTYEPMNSDLVRGRIGTVSVQFE